jgi:hypothetical protein
LHREPCMQHPEISDNGHASSSACIHRQIHSPGTCSPNFIAIYVYRDIMNSSSHPYHPIPSKEDRMTPPTRRLAAPTPILKMGRLHTVSMNSRTAGQVSGGLAPDSVPTSGAPPSLRRSPTLPALPPLPSPHPADQYSQGSALKSVPTSTAPPSLRRSPTLPALPPPHPAGQDSQGPDGSNPHSHSLPQSSRSTFPLHVTSGLAKRIRSPEPPESSKRIKPFGGAPTDPLLNPPTVR